MNERQKALYDYLVSRGNEWTTQADIARELYEYYGNGECCLAPKEFHDTTERIYLLRDLQAIKTDPDFEKLVISSSNGVKIATEEEFDRYIKNEWACALRKLSRIYRMAKKGNRHNQIGIDGNAVEAFLEKNPETP